MSTELDIVERLRSWPDYPGAKTFWPEPVIREAADVIEELRLALEEKTAESKRWHERFDNAVEDASEQRRQVFLLQVGRSDTLNEA